MKADYNVTGAGWLQVKVDSRDWLDSGKWVNVCKLTDEQLRELREAIIESSRR